MSDIDVSVTFRHTAPTDALKQYAERKLQKLAKYVTDPMPAHVILAVDAKGTQVAEIELHLHGSVLCAKESDSDLYAAIDLALDKIERQVRKHKDRVKVQRRRMSA